jgi:hypothetical protein
LVAFVAKVREVFTVVQGVVWVADVRMRSRTYGPRVFGRSGTP